MKKFIVIPIQVNASRNKKNSPPTSFNNQGILDQLVIIPGDIKNIDAFT